MVTLLDIARECGTSNATVSYVLSGRGDERRISPATQKSIIEAAERMGYQRSSPPKPVLPVTPKVELLWPKSELEMAMPSFISGVNIALAGELSPVEFNIRNYTPGHLSSQTWLWNRASSTSAVIVSANADDLKHLEENPSRVPCVLFNRTLPRYSSASIDHEEAGRMIAAHAVARGGADIALVLSAAPLYGVNSRYRAIIQYCQEKNIDLDGRVYFCANRVDDGYDLANRLARSGVRYKVILSTLDMVSYGMLSAFSDNGVLVGKDLELISMSTCPAPILARAIPPVTVVDLCMEETALLSIRLAVDLAVGRTNETRKLTVHPQIIYRRSSPMAVDI